LDYPQFVPWMKLHSRVPVEVIADYKAVMSTVDIAVTNACHGAR